MQLWGNMNTETLMSNDNTSNSEQRKARRRPARGLARKPARPEPEVEVIALEIDEDFDLGGDPYNHTGSHCVINIRED